MEEKFFSGYLKSGILYIMTAIPFIISLITFLSTHSLWKSLTALFAFLSIILLISLSGKFKEYNRSRKAYKDLNDKHQLLLDEKKDIEKRFNLQSDKYEKNIDELNRHKEVNHMVTSLVKGYTPKGKEGKDLIKLLGASIDKIIEDGDKDGI